MSASSPDPAVATTAKQPQQPDNAHRKKPRRVFPIRLAFDFMLLYALGREVAFVYPPFGKFAEWFFAGLNPLLTTGAILATAWFTKTLWESTDEMQRGNDATLLHLEESSRRELRAYVFPEMPTIQRVAVAGHVDRYIELMLRNWGSTPAYNVCCSIIPYHGPANVYVAPDWANSLTRGTNFIIPPNGTLESIIEIPAANEIEQAAIAVGAADTRVVRLHGRLTYVDAYARPQTAEFAYVSDGENLYRGRFKAMPDTHKAS